MKVKEAKIKWGKFFSAYSTYPLLQGCLQREPYTFVAGMSFKEKLTLCCRDEFLKRNLHFVAEMSLQREIYTFVAGMSF